MWIVDPENAGKRVDVLVKDVHPEYSRTKIQEYIKEGLVTVNGNQVKPSYRVEDGDDILVDMPPPPEADLSPNDDVRFGLVAETPDYIVIDKPSGLLVHAYEGYTEPDTLVNGLLARYPQVELVGEDINRAGIVHRLDREVSGTMVVPLNQEMFTWLKAQFHERSIYKEYLAMVFGEVEEKMGIIDTPIARSSREPKRMATHHAIEGKRAHTEFQVLSKTDRFSLLRVVIKTGRHHQIRTHLNSIGHPIVGDTLYAPKRIHNLDRPFLHSHRIGFQELDEDKKLYTAPLPPELFQYARDKQLDYEHKVV